MLEKKGDCMEQIDLNNKLYNECCKEILNKEKILELLNLGADPLGAISRNDLKEHLYGELICDEEECKNLYEITEMFINNGMIHKISLLKNDDDDINPLWMLSFRCTFEGIKTLKLLLDNKIDIASLEEFIEHTYTDYMFLEIPDSDDKEINLMRFKYAAKMLMLCASCSYVCEKSKYLRDVIEFENNTYDISKFYEYDKFDVIVEKDKFYFIDINTNLKVWEIYFG